MASTAEIDAQIAALQARRAAAAQSSEGMEEVKSMFAQIVTTQAKIESRLDALEGARGADDAQASVLEDCALSLRDTADGMGGQLRAIVINHDWRHSRRGRRHA